MIECRNPRQTVDGDMMSNLIRYHQIHNIWMKDGRVIDTSLIGDAEESSNKAFIKSRNGSLIITNTDETQSGNYRCLTYFTNGTIGAIYSLHLIIQGRKKNYN